MRDELSDLLRESAIEIDDDPRAVFRTVRLVKLDRAKRRWDYWLPGLLGVLVGTLLLVSVLESSGDDRLPSHLEAGRGAKTESALLLPARPPLRP